jgi:hypothetical protein
MNGHIHHDEEDLLESLIAGKLPRNLTWSAVVDLIGQIGEVHAHGNDEFTFVVGSQRALFKRPSTHDLDVEEISRLRRFLKDSSVGSDAGKPCESGRVVVVIDHHAAHIYRDLGGNKPESEISVEPYDPFNFHHHLIHRKEAHYKGDRVPEEDSYYEEIAADLAHAKAIILMGHGTGKSSAVEFLRKYLKSHHPETFQRVLAMEIVDLSSLSEAEIEEIAKKHIRLQAIPVQAQDAASL